MFCFQVFVTLGNGTPPWLYEINAASNLGAGFSLNGNYAFAYARGKSVDGVWGNIEFIWQKIIQIAEAGVSVLLVSHELGEVMELSDRILVMYNGEITGNLLNTAGLDEQTVGMYMLGGKKDEA